MLTATNLQYFLAVARRRYLILAAAELGVNHTTVGRHITQLEREIGHRLFDRTQQGWELTPSGQALMEPAEAVEAAVIDAQERVGQPGAGLSGTVRVVCPDGFGAFLFAPAVGSLNQRHPRLVIEIITATTHLPQTARDFDLAVTLEEPSSPRMLKRRLSDYVLRLYATREYLESHPPIRSRSDLAKHSLIWYVDHLLNIRSLRDIQIKLDAPGSIQSTNLVAHWQAVGAGVGVAPLPQFIALHDPRLVVVLPELEFYGTYWLVIPPEYSRLARVLAVTDVIDGVIRGRAADMIGGSRRRLTMPGTRSAIPGPSGMTS